MHPSAFRLLARQRLKLEVRTLQVRVNDDGAGGSARRLPLPKFSARGPVLSRAGKSGMRKSEYRFFA